MGKDPFESKESLSEVLIRLLPEEMHSEVDSKRVQEWVNYTDL